MTMNFHAKIPIHVAVIYEQQTAGLLTAKLLAHPVDGQLLTIAIAIILLQCAMSIARPVSERFNRSNCDTTLSLSGVRPQRQTPCWNAVLPGHDKLSISVV